MRKLKKGDKVKVIKNEHNGNKVGEILTVWDKPSEGYSELSGDNKKCIYFKGTQLYNTQDELVLLQNGNSEHIKVVKKEIIYTEDF